MGHDTSTTNIQRRREDYSRDKAALITKLFGGVASLALAGCLWLFNTVLDLRDRVIKLETREEVRRQSDSASHEPIKNYQAIK